MALLLEPKAMFLHVPKTGGSFVIRALKKLNLIRAHVGREHANFTELFWHDRLHHDDKVLRNLIRRQVGWLPKINPNAFKFCFVREPLSWYVSYWRYMSGLRWRNWGDTHNPYHWAPLALLNGLGSDDFNTFMRNVNRKRPGFVTELYGWYVRPGVHFVGKQENLVPDLVKVLSHLRISIESGTLKGFGLVNESPSEIPKPEWDPEVKNETLRLEYAGYVRYGYPIPNLSYAESLVER